MKKILFMMMLSVVFTSSAAAGVFNETASFRTARAIKLGRGIYSAGGTPTLSVPASISLPPEMQSCDANCRTCDNTSGKCTACTPDRYISGSLCLSCPEKSYCDGKDAVANCTDVSCLSGAFTEATNSGCCCVSNCSGVVCAAGHSPVPGASGCCCS